MYKTTRRTIGSCGSVTHFVWENANESYKRDETKVGIVQRENDVIAQKKDLQSLVFVQ